MSVSEPGVMAAAASNPFVRTLTAFCDDLKGTFPEQVVAIEKARNTTAAQFWRAWQNHLPCLLAKDAEALLGPVRQGFLVGAVRLTPSLWLEVSDATRGVIWRYLRTLALECAMELPPESMTTDTMQVLLEILTEERMDASAGSSGSSGSAAAGGTGAGSGLFDDFQPLFDRIKGFVGGFADISGLADVPFPEIPDRLRNGRIAKLAEDIARQFTPEDFGLDPAAFTTSESDTIESVLRRLADIYQRDPTKLISGAKRVADKIKRQVLGGSLNRDDIIAEAKEFVALFKDHPLFKEAIAKFQDMVGGADGLSALFGGGGDSAPSERRRAVQERLRAKLEKRKAAK